MQVDATSVAKNFRILANSNRSNTLNIYYWGWHLDHHRDIGVLCPWPWTRCTFHMGMDSVANTIFVMIHFESTTRCARVALFLSPLWTLTCATSQGVRTKTTSPRFQYISIITNWRKWMKVDQKRSKHHFLLHISCYTPTKVVSLRLSPKDNAAWDDGQRAQSCLALKFQGIFSWGKINHWVAYL